MLGFDDDLAREEREIYAAEKERRILYYQDRVERGLALWEDAPAPKSPARAGKALVVVHYNCRQCGKERERPKLKDGLCPDCRPHKRGGKRKKGCRTHCSLCGKLNKFHAFTTVCEACRGLINAVVKEVVT
jgi:predicted Zn-ribbon and HTH transcriptional regulator